MAAVFDSLLPQLILLITGLLILLFKILSPRIAKYANQVAILGTIVGLLSMIYVKTGEIYSGFVIDKFSLVGTGLIYLTLLLVLVFSVNFIEERNLPPTEWSFLLIMATLGLTLMFNTYHLLILFIGLELSSLAFYVLCGYFREERKSLEAALKYFILGSVGSAILLLGIAFVFVNQQSIVASDFSVSVSGGLVGFALSFGLVLLGFLFKLSIIPLHFWVPDVYEGAPTLVTAFMSIAVKIAVLGASIRILSVTDGLSLIDWTMLFWWTSAITIIVGNLLALVQENLKRMLAYSSISHAGYLLLGLVALNQTGYTAIVFYLSVYLFMNGLAFGIISLLQSEEDVYFYSDLKGLSINSPLMAGILVICMISLSGLPPTAGFMGKLFLFYGVVNAGYPLLAVIAVLGSVVSVAYYFQVIVYSFMKAIPEDEEFIGLSVSILPRITSFIGGVIILYLGVYPALYYNQLFSIISSLDSPF